MSLTYPVYNIAVRNASPFHLLPFRTLRHSFFIMKVTTVFAILATLTTAVSATFSDASLLNTNAKRLAQGLGPLPPVRRSPTQAYGGHKSKPSGTHGDHGGDDDDDDKCHNGPPLCCHEVERADKRLRKELKHEGITVGPDVEVGMHCRSIHNKWDKCWHEEVCCEKDFKRHGVAVGCSRVKKHHGKKEDKSSKASIAKRMMNIPI